MTKRIKPTLEAQPLRLHLGCGRNPKEGFINIDMYDIPGVDLVHDLSKFPWPFEDNSVDEIFSSHFLEHFSGSDFSLIMQECYRILKPKEENEKGEVTVGKMTHHGPYWSSVRAIQDPTHLTKLSAERFLYYNKEWRKVNGLEHYLPEVDFDFVYGYHWHPDFVNKNHEAQQYALNHYINAVTDITVTLYKKV